MVLISAAPTIITTWPIPPIAPIDGPGTITLPVGDELQSAELLLEIGQIPVVKNSQEGELFNN
jgi:hypothetical protein